jgi:undecaprenyldiphospho-muramoylpentapeptide beta-N-acetylglucosaminyltransferase
VLLSGGGTGGHVYPALAVAKRLQKRFQVHVLYIGARGEIEERLVPRAGIPLETIVGGGLHGVGLLRFARNLIRLLQGFVQAWRITGRFEPDVVLLTGGYISVPVALATWLRRRPIVVYLPDVEPGRAIKLLSRFATRVAVTVAESRQFLPPKVVVTGYPLRPEFQQAKAASRLAARKSLELLPQGKVLLVFGGSRGARSINEAIGRILTQVLAQAQVIHVSGSVDADACRARRDRLPAQLRTRYHLFEYLHEMAPALAAADLVVARAGAGTLGELPFFGLPAILVPYPHAWRYQKVNADYLAERGAAIRLNDETMGEALWPTIEALLRDDKRLAAMSACAQRLARPDAADRLAELLVELTDATANQQRKSENGRH